MTPIFTRIKELEIKNKKLPNNSISNKNINITKLKAEEELKELKHTDAYRQQKLLREEQFPSFVQAPLTVENLVLGVKDFQKRDCYKQLEYYFNTDFKNKVCILNGLSGTGKSTLIYQYLLNMNDDDYSHSAYLKMNSSYSLKDLIRTIDKLQKLDFKYIFIDDITLVKDFINSAHLISDMYCCDDNKIVLSGSDTLSFWIANRNSLYDRNFMIHTTYISYAEHSKLLGTKDIDDYIEYGGALSLTKDSVSSLEISNAIKVESYIDTAICKNIENSLELYKDTYHDYQYVYELCEHNELSTVINTIFDDISLRMIKESLVRVFKSKELLSVFNLENNACNQSIDISEQHLKQTKDFLKHIDLLADLELIRVDLGNTAKTYENYDLVTQPFLIYRKIENLINSFSMDDKFPIQELKASILENLLTDIVILDCKHKLLNNHAIDIFQINFGIGEYDMVIWNHSDEENRKCYLYEIKHCDKIVEHQARLLRNTTFLDYMENEFGTIVKRCILYWGENFTTEDGIVYKNVIKP